MTALVLATAIALSPVVVPATAQARGGCGVTSYRVPPAHLTVFRIHRRGSSIPARVERWRTRDYVAAVAESGAWPAGKPMESLKAGVLAPVEVRP